MSCPHCRDLVATDPKTHMPPLLCPRCGGVLREDTADDASTPQNASQVEDSPTGTLSLASFLHMGKSVDHDAPAEETVVVDEAAENGIAVEVEADTATGREVDIATDAADSTHGEQANAVNGEDGNGDPVTEDVDSMQEDAAEEPVVVVDEIPSLELPISEIPIAIAPVPIGQPLPASPSFTRATAHAATHPRTAKWQWAVLALLSLLLMLQVLIADRARLAADENWRPIITRLCDALRCDVPAWHQPGAFAMLSRDVRPMVGTPGGLHVQATFRNDAAWTQDWPLLQLSLSDADGRVVGTRAFTPAEYLGKSATQGGLAPGQSARIALQLHEPNPGVVAFSFDFR